MKHPRPNLLHYALPALIIGLLSGNTVHADDNWDMEPSIKQSASAESNPLLLSGSHQSLFGSVTEPAVTIKDNTPTTQLNASLLLDENVFNQSEFDSTDVHTNITLNEKIEQWEAGFVEQTDYDTTRTSELTTLDRNTLGSVRHFGNSIAPELAFSPDSSDKIALNASFSDSRYDSDSFVNYHIISVAPSYQYSFDPLNSATLSVQAQRYQTETALNSTIDSVAPTVEWTAIITPMLTAKATVGAEDIHQQGYDITDAQWSWKAIYSADVSYKNELDVFSLDAARALQPYPNGTEFLLNTISLTDTHTLNMLFSANIGASYQFTDSSDQVSTNLKSLLSATAGIAYHLTDTFDVTAAYQYRNQTLTYVPGSEDDNLFMLSLAYHLKPAGKI